MFEGGHMRDLYQVLREKELQIVRIRQEIEALRATIPLLEDDEEMDAADARAYPPLRAASQD
jgi:hypothetical protein